MKSLNLKNNYVKIPVAGIVFFSLLLAGTAFYSGLSWARLKGLSSAGTATTNSKAAATFTAVKSDKPELKFFVMSFCPFGNQIEDALRPVFDLLKNKVAIVPHYIFDKIDNLSTYCASRAGDPAQCDAYVKSGYFADAATCKKTITANLTTCLDPSQYLKTSSGSMYASLHGRQEANQDVRELCAWNQVGDDKTGWWNFVGGVDKNCTKDNADTCWQAQAQQAGLDTNKITDCFNKDAVSLIESELALTTKYKVSGSPTVLINDVAFPPDAAYTNDNTGTLAIGKKVATQDKYRTPNVIKEALCVSFNKTPKECNTILNELSGAAPATGGCGN
jgi:hypothetical protein